MQDSGLEQPRWVRGWRIPWVYLSCQNNAHTFADSAGSTFGKLPLYAWRFFH